MPVANDQIGQTNGNGSVLAVNSLQEFFRDSVEDALRSQKVSADAHTAHYIVNLLTMFARSERLYDGAHQGRGMRPLAFMLGDALECECDRERNKLLQRLGDVALFMAGFFARGFPRGLVDIDYYVSMGGVAYGFLSDSMRSTARPHVFCDIFAELANKFQPFVDVLNEIADSAYVHTDKDVMRLYEIWLRTGSQRAARKLRGLGVIPITGNRPGRPQ